MRVVLPQPGGPVTRTAGISPPCGSLPAAWRRGAAGGEGYRGERCDPRTWLAASIRAFRAWANRAAKAADGGQDNEYVFGELLGMSSGQIAELVERKAIY